MSYIIVIFQDYQEMNEAQQAGLESYIDDVKGIEDMKSNIKETSLQSRRSPRTYICDSCEFPAVAYVPYSKRNELYPKPPCHKK